MDDPPKKKRRRCPCGLKAQRSHCKICMGDKYKPQTNKRSKKELQDKRVWQRYRMRPNNVSELFEKYDRKCHLCKTNPATDIDHRPGTGYEYKRKNKQTHRVRTAVPPEIRGATCHQCNNGPICIYDKTGEGDAATQEYCENTVYCNKDCW